MARIKISNLFRSPESRVAIFVVAGMCAVGFGLSIYDRVRLNTLASSNALDAVDAKLQALIDSKNDTVTACNAIAANIDTAVLAMSNISALSTNRTICCTGGCADAGNTTLVTACELACNLNATDAIRYCAPYIVGVIATAYDLDVLVDTSPFNGLGFLVAFETSVATIVSSIFGAGNGTLSGVFTAANSTNVYFSHTPLANASVAWGLPRTSTAVGLAWTPTGNAILARGAQAFIDLVCA
jgi:hypothetical protein